jgi:hypothetical protein
VLDELADGAGSFAEEVEDVPPSGLGECGEGGVGHVSVEYALLDI